MTNPFNQSRYRNEHELGSAYKLVSEVHEQLDTINYLVQNLKGVRSGNIELKSDIEGKIYWKYVKSEEWVLWGDMTEWFAPLVEDLQQGQANQADNINSLQDQLNTVDQKLDADIDALGVLANKVQTDRDDLDTLTQNISTLQGQVQSLIDANEDFEIRLSALESTVAGFGTSLQDIESRLGVLENG